MEPYCHGNVRTDLLDDQPRSVHEPVHEDSDDEEEWLKKGTLVVDNKEAGIRLYEVAVIHIPLRKAEQSEQPYVPDQIEQPDVPEQFEQPYAPAQIEQPKKPRLRLPNPPLRRPKSSPSSSSEASEMPPAIMKAKPSSEASMLRPRPKPKAGPTEVSSKTETSTSQVTSEPKDELEEWTVLEDKPVGQHD